MQTVVLFESNAIWRHTKWSYRSNGGIKHQEPVSSAGGIKDSSCLNKNKIKYVKWPKKKRLDLNWFSVWEHHKLTSRARSSEAD